MKGDHVLLDGAVSFVVVITWAILATLTAYVFGHLFALLFGGDGAAPIIGRVIGFFACILWLVLWAAVTDHTRRRG